MMFDNRHLYVVTIHSKLGKLCWKAFGDIEVQSARHKAFKGDDLGLRVTSSKKYLYSLSAYGLTRDNALDKYEEKATKILKRDERYVTEDRAGAFIYV